MTLVTIKQASEATGVSPKMIRHYESIGLIKAPTRTENGYRYYSPEDISGLCFIRRARDLGFPFEDIRQLLALLRDKRRSSAEVKQIALRHVAELEAKAAQLAAMGEALKRLTTACPGNSSPHCPILDALDPPQLGKLWCNS
ncbi:Cu(I)-responsive transcriptional regulator [Acidocella sp.]|uniref:Cu(I)-responsive transcriptional regulator n=1 Tax=Acidocella sp. TaxID=50710 RepID=UPI00262B9C15|nr:Cu(I)-responsive transcriptional regulator [Acidocella sp.]